MAVSRTLTLEQVKKAGRFAWHDGGYLWVPGSGFAVVVAELPMSVTAVDWTWKQVPFADGWHHLPGCTCEFCHG